MVVERTNLVQILHKLDDALALLESAAGLFHLEDTRGDKVEQLRQDCADTIRYLENSK